MAGHTDADAPFVDLKDVEKVPLFLALGAASWVLPESSWPRVAGLVASASSRLFRSRRDEYAWFIPDSLTDLLGVNRSQALRLYVTAYYQEYMQVLATYRPGGWHPRTHLIGGEHIEAALAAGNGAVLWITDAAFSPLLIKMVLANAGYRMAQLSRPQHGFSRTRFGMKFLNPIQARAENKHLGRRIVIRDGRTDVALRELRECLQRNELVGITVGNQGHQVERVAMFEGVLEVATGPINLSERTGAPLLPAFLIPDGSATFKVRVDPPLQLPDAGTRSQRYRTVVAQYVRLVEAYVRQHPRQWRGWVEHGNWKQAGSGKD